MAERYKIIDEKENHFFIQCAYLRSVFKLNLSTLAYRTEIIHGLPAEQACYLGIRVSEELIFAKSEPFLWQHKPQMLDPLKARYALVGENRYKQIIFKDCQSQEIYCLDPRNIALSPKFISDFSPQQAFYIGLLAGRLTGKRGLVGDRGTKPKSTVKLRILK